MAHEFFRLNVTFATMEFCFSLMEYYPILTFLQNFPFYLTHTFILLAFVFWVSINGFKQYYALQIFTSKLSQDDAAIEKKGNDILFHATNSQRTPSEYILVIGSKLNSHGFYGLFPDLGENYYLHTLNLPSIPRDINILKMANKNFNLTRVSNGDNQETINFSAIFKGLNLNLFLILCAVDR